MPTIAQAKTMWCPMVRVAGVGQVFNRIDPEYLTYKQGSDRSYFERQQANCHCIATQCMLWRWTVVPRPEYSLEPLDEATMDGYCGLAGSGRV